MKFKFNFLVAILLLSSVAYTQSPNMFNYQVVAKDATRVALESVPIGLKVSILKDNPGGDVAYAESHTVTTDDKGYFHMIVGSDH